MFVIKIVMNPTDVTKKDTTGSESDAENGKTAVIENANLPDLTIGTNPSVSPDPSTPVPYVRTEPWGDLEKKTLGLDIPPIKPEIVFKIFRSICNGATIHDVCDIFKIDPFTIHSWRILFPKFDNSIKSAKKIRAEGISESLINKINTMMKDDEIFQTKAGPTLFKMIERVTSIHDSEQNLQKGTEVNVNVGGRFRAKDPFKDMPAHRPDEPNKNWQEYRIDAEGEDSSQQVFKKE